LTHRADIDSVCGPPVDRLRGSLVCLAA
jgi:hypothetical protein